MQNELVLQLNKITDLLESEKQEHDDATLSMLIASIFDEKKDEKVDEDDALASNRRHCFFQLSYMCLSARLYCQLINRGQKSYEIELEEKITRIIENVKEAEYAWEISDEILLDSFDVLTLVCPEFKKLIASFYPKDCSLFKNKERTVSSDLLYIAVHMVDCFKENGDKGLAAEVAEQLCRISRERNDEEKNRSLVVKVLPYIIDDVPEVAYRICCDNKFYFEEQVDIDAGDFFWFYSYSAHMINQTDIAIEKLERCISIRENILGDNCWYTIVAKCELVLRTMVSTRDSKVRAYLIWFIDGVENKIFEDMDTEYALVMEGRCLFLLLHNDPDMDSMEQYHYYVDLFEGICNKQMKYSVPYLTPRMGKNMKGTICLREGDFIRAERYFLEALGCDSEAEPSRTILSDAQIKSNLLMAYFNQSDFENVSDLLDELLELIDDENDDTLSDVDIYRIYGILVSTYCYFDVDSEAIESILELVREECDSIVNDHDILTEENKEQSTFICSAISCLIQKQAINKADHWTFYHALNKIKQFETKMTLEKRRIVVLNYILALLAYDLDLPTTNFYMRESLVELNFNGVPSGIRVTVLSLVAMYYARNDKTTQANKYLSDACLELTIAWKNSVRYINDTRLMNLLLVAQLQHYCIYTVQRQINDPQSVYNSLIQFKALASLAGRERNRVINAGLIDHKLMERIHLQQNFVAQLEADTVSHVDEDLLTEAYENLRLLETGFSERFPATNQFTNISLERVVNAMPDNSIVIEYFDTVPYLGKGAFETVDVEEEQCIDVFVLKKRNKSCTLGRFVIDKGETVLKKAGEFIQIYQSISNGDVTTDQLEAQARIRYFLYKELISPIKSSFDDVGELYIAPSSELINLPFGLLMEEGTDERLQDNYDITMIECARDFLFNSTKSDLTGRTLVMGDLEYDLKDKIKTDECTQSNEQRCFYLQDYIVKSLPFSGIEAIRISNLVSANCCIGVNASKKALLSAINYKNIHLATHGLVDYEASADTLYASCILLAGAQNWLSDGVVNVKFGNGIVTADEISRQDWRHVELVVLSTCMSGLNDYTINKGFNGIVSALSAAGVKYVICSLWNQSDLGTAVMMEEFYRLYEKEKKSPCHALREAQYYLKNITIRELKEKGWLNSTDVRIQPSIERYSKMNERRKPFRDEIYWGGFECFRCN